MLGFILLLFYVFIYFSQSQWLPNCSRERIGGRVTQQNLTIGLGVGEKTRPLTHPPGPPITESLKSQLRRPLSVIYPSPANGNIRQPAVANTIITSVLSIASTIRVSPIASLCPLASESTLTTPGRTRSDLDGALTPRTHTFYRWVTCQHDHLYEFCVIQYQ